MEARFRLGLDSIILSEPKRTSSGGKEESTIVGDSKANSLSRWGTHKLKKWSFLEASGRRRSQQVRGRLERRTSRLNSFARMSLWSSTKRKKQATSERVHSFEWPLARVNPHVFSSIANNRHHRHHPTANLYI